MPDKTVLSQRFEQALVYAAQKHAHQVRKGSQTPYIAHLMSVCALVLENGGDEDQAVAALLHDAAEDQGGQKTLAEIQEKFGARVAGFVAALSDTFEIPKPPWRARKEAYLQHLAESSDPDLLLISMADKLHNAKSILRDYQQLGSALWPRFTGKKNGTLWYYRSLVEVYRQKTSTPIFTELDQVVTRIEQLAAGENE